MKSSICFFQLIIFSILSAFFSSCVSQKAVVPMNRINHGEESFEMSTKRSLVGQMVMIGIPGYELTDDVKSFLRDYKIGNVILFKWNIKNAVQLRSLTDSIQKEVFANTGKPAFIFVDQEGGRVSRFSSDVEKMPAALNMAEFGSEKLIYNGSVATAKQLLLLGLNADFAPTNDIFSNPKNKVIGDRAYGKTAEDVIFYSGQAMKGLSDGGVVPCVKHFPGHGDTLVDSHHELPVVNKTYDDLKKFELKPFAASIKAGVPMVMTAHILFPNIDGTFPATMSKTILTGILRKDMGFDGIIVTDSLEMNAIKNHYGIVNGALHAIEAGADMICLTKYEQHAVDVLEALADKISTDRLVQSAERIIKVKSQYLKPHQALPKKQLKKKLAEQNKIVESIRVLTEG